VWLGINFWDSGTTGAVTPPVTPPIGVSKGKHAKRQFRVRRADFSSQAAYEFALRTALLGADFAIRPFDEEPVAERKAELPQFIPLDKSLSAEMDTEIKISAAAFEKLQRAAEMDEIELLHLFITVIESEYP
jgi:hypothetical protein